MPWLLPPRAGHPAWDEYLQARANLIRGRADELGSAVAIYREAYRIGTNHDDDLGPAPSPGSRRAAAYDAAQTSLQVTSPSPAHHAPVAPAAVRRPSPGRSQPHRTR